MRRGDRDWSDREMLTILDLSASGMSFQAISERFRTSRSAIAGLVNRITRASAAVPDECVRPENQDGGMPAGWWKKNQKTVRAR